MKNKILFSLLSTFLFSILFINTPAFAAETTDSLINLQVGQSGDLSSSVEIFAIITLLSFLPAIVITMTCYVKIVIVLSLTRQALGVMTAPPNQVITGLALIVTMFVMAPVAQNIYNDAYLPYKDGKASFEETVGIAEKPLKKFMVDNADENHIKMAAKLADVKIDKKEDVPFLVATLANIITQTQDALGMGVLIMAAFVVIDMIVAAVLMLLGMIMLPPNLISLPIKIITFLAAGGYELIIEILVQGIKV
ncbi:flagellar type III secretion system pore protein FliP [Priestia sp. SB1]|uniref:Flagellar biosynthetic protein FliP n=1 Tax=Priestia aryabhattai TaxID=412384 RepID=A0AAX6ND09_PRIAR|nr:flagellar type III secretion system pore protein FliP [Priestia aryabhattai]MDU9693791.1 flagellar type III secretion system pore protein FliP [Priestia aryabhattai]